MICRKSIISSGSLQEVTDLYRRDQGLDLNLIRSEVQAGSSQVELEIAIVLQRQKSHYFYRGGARGFWKTQANPGQRDATHGFAIRSRSIRIRIRIYNIGTNFHHSTFRLKNKPTPV